MAIFTINIIVLDWIINAGYITILIALSLMAFRLRSHPMAYKWFTVGLAYQLCTSVSSEVLYRNNINPNYGGSTFYTFAVIFYGGFFYHLFRDPKLKTPIILVCASQIVLGIVNLLWIQKETINTYTAISHSIIIITFCLLFFYRLLKQLPTENLLNMPVFWFITAEFIIGTGQMLMKSFAHFLINIFHDNLIVLWVFHHGLGIAGNLLIIYGAWLVAKRSVEGPAAVT
jgi:hypothetical protein